MDFKEELIYMSRYVGMRKDFVQAGGGNTSVKISDELMYIKSSGIALSEMNLENGYSLVNYKMIGESLSDYNITGNYDKEIINKSIVKGNKPSIETFLHSITDRYTIHVHATMVNILTCQNNGMSILKELFPNAIYVDYALPGIELGNKVVEACKNKKKELIFLKNHGVIISGNDCLKIINKLEEVINKISNYLNIDISRYNNVSYIFGLYKKINKNFSNLIYLCEDRYVEKALKKNNNQLWNYLIFPDSIVYCGINKIEIQNKDKKEVLAVIKENLNAVIILFNGYIYINASSLKRAKDIEDILSNSAQIYLNSKEKLDYINNNEQYKIVQSDEEKYRKNMY